MCFFVLFGRTRRSLPFFDSPLPIRFLYRAAVPFFHLGAPVAAIVAIPARLKSTRFPEKVLADLFGRPMLWYVYQGVSKAKRIDKVWVLTDSQAVADVVTAWGGDVLMTSVDCPSGTDRIASRLDKLNGDIIVNVQGDEPLIEASVIDRLVEALEDSAADVATPVYAIQTQDELVNPNVVKVVRASDGSALYFSRSPVPHVRDKDMSEWLGAARFWGHAGVYAYRRGVLSEFPNLPEAPLEQIEKLEQLRLLEAGKRFLAVEIDYRPQAVDAPEDLEAVKQKMRSLGFGHTG